jgi:hypothetical protein
VTSFRSLIAAITKRWSSKGKALAAKVKRGAMPAKPPRRPPQAPQAPRGYGKAMIAARINERFPDLPPEELERRTEKAIKFAEAMRYLKPADRQRIRQERQAKRAARTSDKADETPGGTDDEA